jgi:hypothetical protein
MINLVEQRIGTSGAPSATFSTKHTRLHLRIPEEIVTKTPKVLMAHVPATERHETALPISFQLLHAHDLVGQQFFSNPA